MTLTTLLEAEVSQLRHKHYNAQIIARTDVHEELTILRVLPDEGTNGFVPGLVGKRYLQEYFESGDFERDSGARLDPLRTHVFLCGNPAMIGVPRHETNGEAASPMPPGMIGVLARRGFRPDEKSRPGNIHYEKYW